ncbi:MAG: flagellar basal body protein [Actinomycetota bacterium]|nr:flagellar basal body protein [Actinomycetota bacterium]
MSLFDGLTIRSVERALDFESERQRVTAHNIANVSTPGFLAKRLHFEGQLAEAIDEGWHTEPEPSTTIAETPIRLDGNNVSLEQETMVQIQSGLHYESLVEAMSFKFGVLNTAIRMGR